MYRYFFSIMLALSSMVAFSVHAIEFVDLGLPSGNLWAKENLGSASSSYYAWGETKANKKTTEADADFTWKTYLDERKTLPINQRHIYLLDPNKTKNNVTFSGFSSSTDCGTLKDPLFCIVPVTVGSYTHGGRSLPAAYDAATKALGKDYVIPSQKDFQELFTYTTRNRSGSNVVFTSKINGNSISFPKAGIKMQKRIEGKNSSAYCWTSDAHESNSSYANYARLDNPLGYQIMGTERYRGLPIRPIKRQVPYTKEDFHIGLGEPSYQVSTQHSTLTYANNDYVSDMAAAFDVSTFRVWMNFNLVFAIRDGNVRMKPQKDEKTGLTAWESLKDFVEKLNRKGINRICFVSDGYIVDESYRNYLCWDGQGLNWYSANDLEGENGKGKKQIRHAYSCSPNPNTEPDAYLRFLENQEKVFKILADSFPDVEFFEASNEPDLGVNLGDKWQVLRSLKPGTADFNSKADTIVKYSAISKSTAQSLLRSRINEAKTAKYPNELLYKIQTDLCFYISKALKKSARLSRKPKKLLSPAFTTTGESFDFLKGMYDEIANGYRIYGTGALKDTDPNNYFQILNIHPYLFHHVQPDTSCACKNYDDWRSHVEEIYRITIDNGHRTSKGKTIPVWFTEFGFTDKNAAYKSSIQYENSELLYQCMNQVKNMGFVNTVVAFRMNDFRCDIINPSNDAETGQMVQSGFGMIEYLTKSSDANKSLKPIGERLCGIVAYYDTEARANGDTARVLIQNVRNKIASYINKLKTQPAPMSSMPTDVDDAISVSNDIAIYPNPTTGLLYVACGDGQTIKTLSLMDANGKVLMVKEVNEDVSVLDLSHWEKNLYFVKITTNENTVVEKILLK